MRAQHLCQGLLLLLCGLGSGWSQTETVLPGSEPLTAAGDRSAQMVAGIDAFLMRELAAAPAARAQYWQREFSAASAYKESVAPNRERFRRYIGAVDPREPAGRLELMASLEQSALLAETEGYAVFAVRWPVFADVDAEGLLLRPKIPPVACVVALPDADQTPEMLAGLAPGLPAESQFARRLVEQGCLVLIPTLVNRQDTWSGNSRLNRFTNQPHREWIYRQAFELGRHVIGYEVQAVLAAVDWFSQAQTNTASEFKLPKVKIGVAGYAEGGLIAFYSAALDPRIEATLVSGYFDSRQRVWEEPIYRNVFGLLQEFGDAEIASLIAPRTLIVEHAEAPAIAGPPAPRTGRGGAAPGQWGTPAFHRVESECNRAATLLRPLRWEIELVHGNEGMAVGPGSDYALKFLLQSLGAKTSLRPAGPAPKAGAKAVDADARQQRLVAAWEEHTQRLLRQSERVRDAFFWQPLASAPGTNWAAACQPMRNYFWDEVIGRVARTNSPLNPHTRKIDDQPAWTGYEVTLDVFPDVFAWGYLLVPKNLRPGERRPVVVCQHGLEGVPEDVVTADASKSAFGYYQAFAARLAERGFITYAPHNPYRGGDRFRVLQRKANPLKKSLFSIILAQHDRTLDWLASLPFVDPARLGFYGLSYGGKTAMRAPALLDRYCLSICSADFNEWVKKNATTDSGYSYMFTGEYEMPEFNLGHTLNYAEMAALIAPRPFMVERGHHDGVAPDEWVAYEFAKVRRHYTRLGLADQAEIEFFNGPHSIHGAGTFEFLHRHLNWPKAN